MNRALVQVRRWAEEPLTVDRILQQCQQVMLDLSHLSRIGPSALSFARRIFAPKFKCLEAESFDWGLQANELGIPLRTEFQHAWISKDSITDRCSFSSGAHGKVFFAGYHGNDVLLKYSSNFHVGYDEIIKEAAIGVQMMFLGVGPPIIGLQEGTHEASDLPAIVFCYLPGTITLEDMVMKINEFTPKQIIKVAADVAKKIAIMHRNQYLHNDVNANNVIVIPDTVKPGNHIVYLIDFGSATYGSLGYFHPAGIGPTANLRIAQGIEYRGCRSTRADTCSFGFLLQTMCNHSNSDTVKNILRSVKNWCCLMVSDERPAMSEVADQLNKAWIELD